MDTSHDITIEFEKGFQAFDKGPFLMEVERLARKMLCGDAAVFMHRKGDDSKLRNLMTPNERAKL